MKISEIVTGQRKVTITAKVDSVGKPREVNLKSGEQKRVADAVISDESGSIKLTLWDGDIDKVRAGDKITIDNGYITTYKGENSVSIGKFGRLTRV